MTKNADVIVIGAGPAGIAASISMQQSGLKVCLLEAGDEPGGKLNQWHHLFPNRMEAGTLKNELLSGLKEAGVGIFTGEKIHTVQRNGTEWELHSAVSVWQARAVLIAGGFDVFDARLKEEYGYGIYRNVITSVELETLFAQPQLLTKEGNIPRRVAFVHCVGSRDEKVGNHHCSRACCVTGVKQAIEVREKLPACEVYNFYMDMRMFGTGYEELYRDAQEKHNVTFIRGRVSEASENQEGRIVIKAEDTLSGRPLKMTVDLLVLLVGMVPARMVKDMKIDGGIPSSPDGFLEGINGFTGMNRSPMPGLFLAGTCTGPRSIPEAISDGRSAALEIMQYCQNSNGIQR